MTNTTKGAASLALAAWLAAASLPAFAGSATQSVENWKTAASAELSAAMKAPQSLQSLPDTLHHVELLVARDGRVLEADFINDHGDKATIRATRKTIRSLNELPPLPAEINSETALVHAYLIYASSTSQAREMAKRIDKRIPKTRVIQMAGTETPVLQIAAAY